MKKLNLLLPALLISVSLLFVYCSKEGDEGPQGPAGPAGPAGPQGPKGDTGTANVVYSQWLDVTYQPIKDQTSGDTLAWQATIPAPKLSNTILSNGLIRVYINWGTSAQPEVEPLPLTDLFFGVIINTTFAPQQIFLLANENWGTATVSGSKVQQYRYVLVPGGVPARMPTINWNNYEEVKKYLNLTD